MPRTALGSAQSDYMFAFVTFGTCTTQLLCQDTDGGICMLHISALLAEAVSWRSVELLGCETPGQIDVKLAVCIILLMMMCLHMTAAVAARP